MSRASRLKVTGIVSVRFSNSPITKDQGTLRGGAPRTLGSIGEQQMITSCFWKPSAICRLINFGCLTILVAAATSCGPTRDEKLNTWIGASPDLLISQWGPPTSTYEMPNGGLALTYSSGEQSVIPGVTFGGSSTTQHQGTLEVYSNQAIYTGTSTTSQPLKMPDTVVDSRCSTTVITDPSRTRIATWTYRGAGC